MREANPWVGRVLGRYRLLDEVGRGGMAVVYRARDEALGREVAVKVLHAHLASDAESRARLAREAQAVAKLRHDNILEIHDYSGSDSDAARADASGESFLVTEFIRGRTLTAILAAHGTPPPEIAALVCAELCAALAHAHGLGVIHRDVKPENVMIRDDGRVKLTDFGIAQIVDKERLTATGQLIGSPAYLAPELVEGGRVDFRTDVFALGIVLYRTATGQLPFTGRNPHEVMKRIVDGRFEAADRVNPLVGTHLARTIARALARDPAARFEEMATFRAALIEYAAAAGLVDVRAEIAAWIADPAGFVRSAPARIGRGLVASARREAAAGRRAAAVAIAQRALALDPDSAEARRVIAGAGRARLVGRAAASACAVAVLAGGAITWRSAARAVRGAPTSDLREAEAGGRSGLSEASDHGAPLALAETASRAVGADRGAATFARRVDRVTPAAFVPDGRARRHGLEPAPATRLREVRFNVVPTKNVEILVDGLSRGSWVPASPLRLAAGPHTLELRSPYCLPKRVDIAPEATSLGDVHLSWRPARLLVKTRPEAASVRVIEGGAVRGARGGAELLLPIPPDSPTGRALVTIAASAEGYATSELRDVELVAGQRLLKEIVLSPSR